ncbi:hypothetical protein TVAG_270940 [Trichomonas vaginalis G3]|uniref:Initiator binding domain-containing protein n=1 Tax=Trichomonas vaginalis (strain ATCC PRA-98 / G3) TaxID=412133 RepID=A2FII6_TRIV3|nr:transcription-initiator DNA-binding domain ibd family [Trichomonas vaginalis G3]EAX95303.1 hypothetical protein TVAG_270940 [Trichomonas vaginalis G3]KAI5539357.1 transcription-initiator DNA-binding domain ibd family [Trichomonas vaginalis G3]|eukprot:XP_001308233.1 hypothetical protein [Trichomonas vaginalis G3]
MNFSLCSPLGIDTIDDIGESPNYASMNTPELEFPELNDSLNFDIDYGLRNTNFEPFSAPYPPNSNESQEVVSKKLHKRAISSPIKIHTPAVQQKNLSSQLTAFLSARSILSLIPVQVKQKENRQKFTPIEDAHFTEALSDTALIVNPVKLGFIPRSRWVDKDFTFGELVAEFFQKKNNASCRFSYKLYNALKLSTLDSKFDSLVGVKWINDYVLHVDKIKFAHLLGIKSIDGSLFHQQGNFPSHGFIEMNTKDVDKLKSEYDVSDVDYENIRLLTHVDKIFVRNCTERDLESCKWINSRPKPQK